MATKFNKFRFLCCVNNEIFEVFTVEQPAVLCIKLDVNDSVQRWLSFIPSMLINMLRSRSQKRWQSYEKENEALRKI